MDSSSYSFIDPKITALLGIPSPTDSENNQPRPLNESNLLQRRQQEILTAPLYPTPPQPMFSHATPIHMSNFVFNPESWNKPHLFENSSMNDPSNMIQWSPTLQTPPSLDPSLLRSSLSTSSTYPALLNDPSNLPIITCPTLPPTPKSFDTKHSEGYFYRNHEFNATPSSDTYFDIISPSILTSPSVVSAFQQQPPPTHLPSNQEQQVKEEENEKFKKEKIKLEQETYQLVHSNFNASPLVTQLQKEGSSSLGIPKNSLLTSPSLEHQFFGNWSRAVGPTLLEKGLKEGKTNGPYHPKKTGFYSSSGFDMMGVLARVSTRPCPHVNLGPVDASCAFLVCDINQPDMPIVYVSETFEKMTGYSAPDIMGRNCRFLQSPSGIVEQGSYRQFCDHSIVVTLKNAVQMLQECQHTLINYRKGGQPFINLLTLIPICWEREFEYTHFVGFQVDLVEQPHAILNRLKNLSLPSQEREPSNEFFIDITKFTGLTDVSEAQTRFYQALVQQMDLVHSLSFRGVFLYASPSYCKFLEYKESDIVGHHLSEFCHPGDLVSVLRELKDSFSCSKPVQLVYRARKHYSGYCWLELSGQCAQAEKNRGKKFIVLSGREKKVLRLHQSDFMKAKGHVDTGGEEVWSKLGLEGIFLHSNLPPQSTFLNYSRMDLQGKSLIDLTLPKERETILKALHLVCDCQIVILTHSIRDKVGQFQKVTSTFFPCDMDHVSLSFCLHKCTNVESEQLKHMEAFPSSKIQTSQDDLFSSFSLDKPTSWQYELHQLRLDNQKLKEEMDQLQETSFIKKKSKAKSKALENSKH